MRVEFTVFGSNKKYLVNADPQSTIEDVLRCNSINASFGTKFLVLYNGKNVDSLFTLNRLGITDDSNIILFQKKIQEQIPKVEILTEEEREERIEESIFNEQCRIADLGFIGWESDQNANSVIQEMYELEQSEIEEEEIETQKFEYFFNATVISQSTNINEKPLPFNFLIHD